MQCEITRYSPLADRVFAAFTEVEQIATGYNFTEGPVWDIKKECLYFTDFRENKIYRWQRDTGVTLYTGQANRAIGLSMDAAGRIISTESSKHRIAYVDDKSSEQIANSYDGKQFSSPNDVVVARDGSIYFTDPYSEAMGEPRQMPFNGVFRIGAPGGPQSGQVRVICESIGRPNGLAFSPDESILYVNDTNLQQIFSFRMHADGGADAPQVFATLDTAYGAGAPDGMKVDVEGNVYVTGPGGLWVLAPDGEPVAVLHCPEFVGNFCFGGSDSRWLYLTASTSVYRLPVGIAGIVLRRD